jgi:lipoprotein-anchoring transpeptidase ErfK/SrfK
VVVIAVLLVLAVALAAALLLSLPRLDASDSATLTRDATPVLEVRVERPVNVQSRNASATIDGRAVPADDVRVLEDGSLVQVRAPRLDDGEHDVVVEVAGAGVLRRTLTAEWTLTVDTQAPEARIVGPSPAREATAFAPRGTAVVTELPLTVQVDAEPGAQVRITSDAADSEPRDVEVVPAEGGELERHETALDLPQGSQQLVVTTTDEAGNVTETRRRVLVDTAGPNVVVRAPRVVRDAALSLPITARDPHGVELSVRVDGSEKEDSIEVADSTPAPGGGGAGTDDAPVAANGSDEQPGGADEDAGDDATATDAADAEPLPIAVRGAIVLDEPAYEGRHAVEVVAVDSLGQRRTVTRTVFVDSTERLGEAAGLRSGARGADVLELHDALVEGGVATRAQLAADARARTYGAPTRDAVTRFQNQRGMSADGIAGSDTIAALTLKIVVDRGTKQLTLYRLGEVVKTWGVAVGSPEYPTPAGEFEIQSMQENPTWTPPDSDWAKDAEPIPPGPDNPLGTRWMAIYGTVGIHGTNNPASIGYSVSHGCIRMRIPDVEELFDMVTIGTPVTVV